MKHPLISVVIPTYNTATYLPEVLDSVFAQTYTRYEVILVDDGSTDETEEVVTPYLSRLLYIKQENSGGCSQPRNVGIGRAQGEYIAICDSDDVMMPTKLADAAEILGGISDVDLVFTNFAAIDEQSRTTNENYLASYRTFRSCLRPTSLPEVSLASGPALYSQLLHTQFIFPSGVVARRSIYLSAGGFDESLNSGEDRDMWLRLARAGHVFAYDNRVQFGYRQRSDSMSSDGWKRFPAKIKVQEKQLPHITLPADRRFVSRRINDLRLGYAWGLRRNGDHPAALRAYRVALAERWSWAGIAGWLRAWLQMVLAGPASPSPRDEGTGADRTAPPQ
jgi:glycosyltransferase involved in cell wall biosynthesis